MEKGFAASVVRCAGIVKGGKAAEVMFQAKTAKIAFLISLGLFLAEVSSARIWIGKNGNKIDDGGKIRAGGGQVDTT